MQFRNKVEKKTIRDEVEIFIRIVVFTKEEIFKTEEHFFVFFTHPYFNFKLYGVFLPANINLYFECQQT